MDNQETGVSYSEMQHGPLDKLLYEASKYVQALETDIDVQRILTAKPMFEEQLGWLAEIENALHAARQACKGNNMDTTNRKNRLRNQEAGLAEIYKKLCVHLQIDTVEDGDDRCQTAKRRAMEELPHAIGRLAAQGYRIYYNQSVVSYEGLNYETYKQLDRISAMGDPVPNTIGTFKRALEYFVTVYHRAYSITQEEQRDNLFKAALQNLVASYPLYLEREYTLAQEQEPLII